ncbi:serine/threonine protein kinase [Streptomyces sp. SAI-117]|uniref:serine/threonine-protein kinase n=1 Tax=Streptomyces sp. SAI-117 TaxID=2940546 RepID=UPI0024735065|nr:serine/threonine-protein kinase [Streptomyces sp. SAI-117]MDH6570341.1 serine/threonine protein kinase [Streptomyces sp. SAI-117]
MTGRYRLVESIGQGGMGRVWRAADEMLDRQVAVKEMRIDGLDAEDTRTRRERTLREARATARIDHPNVVRVYDVVDEGERLWIVMELVKGRSLERMTVEDGPLGPRETALLGLGLVRALRQVHARGVLHRDIKPGNVLVESGDRTGHRIVLTDFGIAAMQDAEALTMVGMLVGSPDYMAPERVSGRPQGPPSDIWSLGATLCAALGGRSPFSRDTTLATLHAVLYEEPELPATAGPLTDILTALLEKDPSIRPGLDEVESSLNAVALPAPTPTLRMEPGSETGTPERERPEASERDRDGGDGGSAAQEADLGRRDDPREPSGADGSGVTDGSGTAGGRGTGDSPDAVTPSEPSVPSAASGAPAEPSGTPAGLPDGSADPPDAPAWTPRESPTPAYLGTRVVRAVRDPRVPTPEAVPEAAVDEPAVAEPSDAVPGRTGVAESPVSEESAPEVPRPAEPSDAVPSATPPEEAASSVAEGAEPVAVQPQATVGLRPSASTEAVSEERSEVRSEASSGNSTGAALRAGATTTSTPLASAPTQDSLAAGAPTEHFPMPDAPTRDTPTRVASAPTRVGQAPTTRRRSDQPGVSLVRGGQAVPGQYPGHDHDPAESSATDPDPRPDPRTDPDPRPDPGQDPDPALVLGPHPHRVPPGELPGAAPHRGRRRTALVAAGSMVAASAVVVAIILATTSGSPGDDKAGGSPSASVSASEPGASTPGGTPSATVEGTSRPRSLPPGAHEEAGGFAWATPTGWRRDVKTGAEVHYTSPDGKQELAAKSSLARGDLMETWRTSEQNAHQGQDYEKIRLEETTFRNHPAVVWEYTFTLGGVPWHARLLGFNVGDKSYQINTWYQPDVEKQALETYEEVKESFTVL